MNRRMTITCIIVVAAATGFSQITIDECLQKARERYPLMKQFDLIRQSERRALSNASRGYLPQLSISAKATYQSEVTKFDLPQLPANSPLAPLLSSLSSVGADKDQYLAAAEVSQTLWDGGDIAARKKAARAAATVDLKKNEADLYALNERVQQLFFGILLTAEQLRQNELLRTELQTNLERIAACVKNGIAGQADADAVKVELLNAEQRKIDLLATRTSFMGTLSAFIGEELSDSTKFVRPADTTISDATSMNRPELALFESQRTVLESQIAAVNAGVFPRISLFFQGGYGRPGLNMLKNEFSPYYLTGLRLQWNLTGFYGRANSIARIRLDMEKTATLRDVFVFNTHCQARQQTGEIGKYRALISTDDSIIVLRSSIKSTAEKKVENGTLTVTDLLREITAENIARQTRALHEIQLLMSVYTLKNTLNSQEKL